MTRRLRVAAAYGVLVCMLAAGAAWGGWLVRAQVIALHDQRASLEADAARLTGERDQWERAYHQMQAPPPRRCVKGTFYAASDWGLFGVGEMEMCGENMSTSPVMGPSFEAIVRTQQQEIEALVNERDRLKEKCYARS